jgi:hypothetical protein
LSFWRFIIFRAPARRAIDEVRRDLRVGFFAEERNLFFCKQLPMAFAFPRGRESAS